MLAFSFVSNVRTESNSRSVLNCSLIFGIDGNSQESINSNDTCLTITIADIIIYEGLSFNLSQNHDSRMYWSWQGTFQKYYSS